MALLEASNNLLNLNEIEDGSSVYSPPPFFPLSSSSSLHSFNPRRHEATTSSAEEHSVTSLTYASLDVTSLTNADSFYVTSSSSFSSECATTLTSSWKNMTSLMTHSHVYNSSPVSSSSSGSPETSTSSMEETCFDDVTFPDFVSLLEAGNRESSSACSKRNETSSSLQSHAAVSSSLVTHSGNSSTGSQNSSTHSQISTSSTGSQNSSIDSPDSSNVSQNSSTGSQNSSTHSQISTSSTGSQNSSIDSPNSSTGTQNSSIDSQNSSIDSQSSSIDSQTSSNISPNCSTQSPNSSTGTQNSSSESRISSNDPQNSSTDPQNSPSVTDPQNLQSGKNARSFNNTSNRVMKAGRPASKGRKPTTKATSENNKLPPCRVCGDCASGLHYGVNTCEACKRFYRRAVRRKRGFKCRGQKKCVIKGKKNNLCGYCRYQQCLAQGMSQNAIRTGRYTHEKRAQNIQEVQRLVTESACAVAITEAEVAEVVSRLVEGHDKVITNAHVPMEVMVATAREVEEEFRLKKEMFGFGDSLTEEQYDEVFQVTGLDLDERKAHMKFVSKAMDDFVFGYVHWAKSVPGFCELSVNDQANLLKLARVEVWYLSAYRGFLEDHQCFYPPNRYCRHRIEVDRLLGKAYTNQAFTLTSMANKLALTFPEVVLLKAVCLTFSDRCVLDDPRKVEAIQWHMLRCLMHLLERNRGEGGGGGGSVFYKVMDLCVALRNLTELSRKALNTKHFSEAIRSNSSLVDMFLF